MIFPFDRKIRRDGPSPLLPGQAVPPSSDDPPPAVGDAGAVLRVRPTAPIAAFSEISRRTSPPLAPMILHARVVDGCGGGPDKTILRSAKYARAAGLAMGAVYIYPSSDPGINVLSQQAAKLACPFWAIPEIGPADPRTIFHLIRLCRRLRVAVWHGHDYKTNFLGLVLRRFWPMKLVTTVHGWTSDTRRIRFYERIDRWCLPRYDHVLAVSADLTRACGVYGVPPHRLSFVPNAIELSLYPMRSDPNAARLKMGVDPGKRIIVVVGRLSPEKGIERAIKAAARLQKQYPSVELHIVGDGPERKQLESFVRLTGLTRMVRFWGWQPDPRPHYEMADILLLPSYTEGSPNVIFEAMAVGVPVAATDVGAVRQQLDDGRCGVILDPKDWQRWPMQMMPLLASASLRRAIGRLARLQLETRFSFEKRMKRIVALYRRLLGIADDHAHVQVNRKAA